MREKLERYDELKSKRAEWHGIFQEVAKYCYPEARNIVKSVNTEEAGNILTVNIADTTAIKASRKMTSGIYSYLMPVGVKWFDLKPTTPNPPRDVQRQASMATDVLHSEIWRSNFTREMFQTIRSLCVFGTACISVEYLAGRLHFRNYHIADIFFEEDSKGRIDTVFRRLFYTARQAIQEFGEENVSEAIKMAYQAKKYTQKFEIVHCVYPRKDYDDKYKDKKPYVSEWIEIANKHTLKVGGFDSQPYLIGRFERAPDELMGRSPAMELLPDIKMLNDMRFTFVESSEKASNPPLIIEDDGVIGQPATGPQDLIVKRAGSEDPHPLQTGANPQLTGEVINLERQGVMEGFYNDLFQALAQYRNMTAYEVSERVEEKMVMLAPTISGLQKELLDPLIMRSLALITGTPVLPNPIPDDVDIAYQGRLALAMSNMQTNAIEITIGKWSPYQQFYPVLDNLDLDKAFSTSALNAGVPADMVLSDDEVNMKRKQSQEAGQQQQQLDMAEQGSKAIKNIGSVMPEALQNMAGMV